jgi:DNA-binding NarL/FixJ family response regulator
VIRVVIADDHALVREGLRRMLTESGRVEVIGEAADGAAAIAQVGALRPDVLLLDISMPGVDGLQAAGAIAALSVPTKVLILSMHDDEQYALRTLRAGADGFIGKGARLDQLITAINAVHAGDRYLPERMRQSFAAKGIRPDAAETAADALSPRELQVMQSLAAGSTNREIAEELGISVKTVDTHRSHVLKKLGLRNNSDITRFAIRHGYLNPA